MLLVAALRRDWARVGALVFGVIYVVLAPLGFLDGDDAFDVIYSGWRENWIHATLAVQGIGFGALGLRQLARERSGGGAPRGTGARGGAAPRHPPHPPPHA